MNILTTTGYKSIENVTPEDSLIAYDVNTGVEINNRLISKDKWTHSSRFTPEYDEDGHLVKTSEQIFDELYGGWNFYRVNDTWTLFALESIWANNSVIHVSDLKIGDTIYDEDDNDVTVTSIQPVSSSEWWRLKITGDHSYIADGITLHNPTRYWVGGGSSTAWNATGNTNWSDTSGGSNNASVPTAVDDVIFDGSGSNAQSNSNISANQTITTFSVTSGYSGSISHSAQLTLAGNLTFGPNQNISGSGTLVFASASVIIPNGKTYTGPVTLNTSATNKTISGSAFTTLGTTTIGINNCSIITASNASLERWITTGLVASANLSSSTNAEIVLRGGTWSSGGNIYGDITLSGSVTISGLVILWGNTTPQGKSPVTFRYISGSGAVTASGATIALGSAPGAGQFNTFLDLAGVNFGTITPRINAQSGDSYYFLSSSLTASVLNFGQNRLGFSGSAGFIAGTLINSTNQGVSYFAPGVEYRITSGMFVSASALSKTTYSSFSSSSLAILTLDQGAVCNVVANFTRIDASRGRTINTFTSVVSSSVNVRSYSDIPTTAYSSVG